MKSKIMKSKIMKNKYIFTLLILFLIINCTGKKNKYIIENFPVNDSLIFITKPITCNLLRATKIITTNKNLIVFDFQENDIFKVFELPTEKFLFSYGKTGKGPKEFNCVYGKTLMPIGDDFVFQDMLKLKTVAIGNNTLNVIKEQWLKPQSNPINGLVRLNDSLIIIDANKNDKFENTCLNLNNDNEIYNFNINDDDLNIGHNSKKEQAYIKASTTKPDGSKIAIFYIYLNEFKIFNNHFELMKKIYINNKRLDNKFSIKNFQDNIIYNGCPYSTNKYIFVVNPNCSRNTINKDINNYKPEISVWDWNGNPIAHYKINKAISCLAISEQYQKIYAVSLSDMNSIFEVKIPKILTN